MDSEMKSRLESLALERLEVTADDEERWSFLFRTEGAVDFIYCPWEEVEEFDGDVEDLDLPWSPERLELIEEGEAEPTEQELAEWRRAKCQQLADDSECAQTAWIVPLHVDGQVAGWALFLCGDDPDEAPTLNGVFATIDAGKAALAVVGAIAAT